MTAQEILLASLDYKRLVEITGIPIPPAAIGLLNGLTEYLCAKEQADDCLHDTAAQPRETSG